MSELTTSVDCPHCGQAAPWSIHTTMQKCGDFQDRVLCLKCKIHYIVNWTYNFTAKTAKFRGSPPDKTTMSTGGDAFPMAETEWGSITPGMSLLDWFAGQVAPGIMASVMGKTPDHVVKEVHVGAVATFRVAQALVAESERLQEVGEDGMTQAYRDSCDESQDDLEHPTNIQDE